MHYLLAFEQVEATYQLGYLDIGDMIVHVLPTRNGGTVAPFNGDCRG